MGGPGVFGSGVVWGAMSGHCLCKFVVRAALALPLVASVWPAAALEEITYLVPAPVELPNQGPLVVAKALGLYAKGGYDVTFLTARGGVDVAKQVGVGNAPIGNALGDTSIIVRANGVPVRTVAVQGAGSLSIVVARTDRGIRTLTDLKGKTVAALSYQDTSFYALLGMLATVGLAKNDVNIEAAGPSNSTLTLEGSADACMCAPDGEVRLEDGLPGVVVAMPANQYFPAMSQAVVASDATIKEHPELVRAMVRGTLAGMKMIVDDPAGAAKTYAAAVESWKGREAEVERIFRKLDERSYTPQTHPGAMDAVRLAQLQDFYLREGIIERASPVADLYTNEFVGN